MKENTKEVAVEAKEEIIFGVYGTLKAGHGNHTLLRGRSEYLGEFTTEPKYTLFDGGFPIVERGGKTSIKGELYKTSDKQAIKDVFNLEGCDRKQDNGGWYTFDLIDTEHGKAHMFVMNAGRANRTRVVESGRWGR